MPEVVVNYWAVLGAAVAAMIVGALWYGPLFGKTWGRLMGMSYESMKARGGKAYIVQTLAALVMANVLAHERFVWGNFFGSSMSMPAFVFQLAFWLWLGFVATTQIGAAIWENKSWKLFFLNTGYSLVSLVAMALVLTYWQ